MSFQSEILELPKNQKFVLKAETFYQCHNQLKKYINFNLFKYTIGCNSFLLQGDYIFSTVKITEHPYFNTIFLKHPNKPNLLHLNKIWNILYKIKCVKISRKSLKTWGFILFLPFKVTILWILTNQKYVLKAEMFF